MGDPDRRSQQRRRSDRPSEFKNSTIFEQLRHLFTPSLDPVRAVIPSLAWISDPKMPRRVLVAIIAVLLYLGGIGTAEIRTTRTDRQAKIDHTVDVIVPKLEHKAEIYELRISGYEGRTTRIENKLDAGNNKLQEVLEAVAELRVAVRQIPKKGDR
jgi:hypothetical protein